MKGFKLESLNYCTSTAPSPHRNTPPSVSARRLPPGHMVSKPPAYSPPPMFREAVPPLPEPPRTRLQPLAPLYRISWQNIEKRNSILNFMCFYFYTLILEYRNSANHEKEKVEVLQAKKNYVVGSQSRIKNTTQYLFTTSIDHFPSCDYECYEREEEDGGGGVRLVVIVMLYIGLERGRLQKSIVGVEISVEIFYLYYALRIL